MSLTLDEVWFDVTHRAGASGSTGQEWKVDASCCLDQRHESVGCYDPTQPGKGKVTINPDGIGCENEKSVKI